jgi:hypothetical protein
MKQEQKKIMNNQFQTRDEQIYDRKKTSLVKAISEMKIDSLCLVLDDSLTYQQATKDVFLNKINDVFKHFKKTDDSLLVSEGNCNSKECPNYNNCGALFYSYKTGDNFNLIFEVDDDENVQDICCCQDFKSNMGVSKIKKGKELQIKFFEDELADFSPDSEYNYINITSLQALADFDSFKADSSSENEILDWLKKYSELNNALSFFDLRYINEHSFFHLYKTLFNYMDFLKTKEGCAKVIQICSSLLEEKKASKIWHTTNNLRFELRKSLNETAD